MAFELNRVNSFQVQKVYKWILSINDIDIKTQYLEAITFPTMEFSGESFHFGGGEVILPSFTRVGDVSITFQEDEKGTILRALEAWKLLVVNEEGVFGYPDSGDGATGFKKKGTLMLLDGSNNEHTEISLRGMWPLSTSPVALTYTESAKVVITQEFAVDRVTIED